MNSWRRFARFSERRMQFSMKSFIHVAIRNFVRLSFHQFAFRQSISSCIYSFISANTYHYDNRYYYLFAVILTESSLYFIPLSDTQSVMPNGTLYMYVPVIPIHKWKKNYYYFELYISFNHSIIKVKMLALISQTFIFYFRVVLL